MNANKARNEARAKGPWIVDRNWAGTRPSVNWNNSIGLPANSRGSEGLRTQDAGRRTTKSLPSPMWEHKWTVETSRLSQWMCECCECLTIGLFEIERQIKGFAPGEPKQSPVETRPSQAARGVWSQSWSWSFECTAGGDFIASTTCWEPPKIGAIHLVNPLQPP